MGKEGRMSTWLLPSVLAKKYILQSKVTSVLLYGNLSNFLFQH